MFTQNALRRSPLPAAFGADFGLLSVQICVLTEPEDLFSAGTIRFHATMVKQPN